MSVLIKGMEMPTSCWRCPFCLTVDPDTYRCIPTGEEFESTFDAIDHIVCDCPLVPVPPHGRLIDADALVKSDSMVRKMMMFGGEYVYTQSEIDCAPTIISTEEEE